MAVTLSTTKSVRLQKSSTEVAAPQGYCHDLKLKVSRDGVIQRLHPDGSGATISGPIILGNKGDLNITRLTFDLTDLQETVSASLLGHYVAKLGIYDTKADPATSEPKIYTIATRQWVVPEEILAKSTTYRCILILLERAADENTIDLTEQWVSQEFITIVQNTFWNNNVQTAINNAIDYQKDYDEQYGYLTKIPILLNPDAEHYNIKTDTDNFGMKKDMYVKRLEFTDVDLDEGFTHRYGIFVTSEESEETIYAVKFSSFSIPGRTKPNTYVCLIPQEVTAVAGTVQFCIVATTDDVDSTPDIADDLPDRLFKRWVGNPLLFTVTDNFLTTIDTYIPEGEIQSSFILPDGSILITVDNKLFQTKEE